MPRTSSKKRTAVKNEVAGDVSIVEPPELRPRRSHRRVASGYRPPIKVENPRGGIVKCPKCALVVLKLKGCNVTTCHNMEAHGGHFFYFCYHCKAEIPNGEYSKCKCRKSVCEEARIEEQEKRNDRAAKNPVDLTAIGDDDDAMIDRALSEESENESQETAISNKLSGSNEASSSSSELSSSSPTTPNSPPCLPPSSPSVDDDACINEDILITVSYHGTSFGAESDSSPPTDDVTLVVGSSENFVAGGIEYGATDNQAHPDNTLSMDTGTLYLDKSTSEGVSSSDESKGTDSSPITDDQSLQLREVQYDKHVGTIEDAANTINQDDGGDDFPPLPPLPDQVVEAGNLPIKSTRVQFKPDVERWHEMYRQLVAYNEEHGDCLVSKNDEKNKKLGVWVNEQREQHRLLKERKKSAMTEERIAKLEEIGFVWNAQKTAWESMFRKLIEYKEEHGDCLVSRNDKKNKKLGVWVKEQRWQYCLLQDGKKSKITKERVAKLEEIEFVWNALETAWESMFSALIEYKEDHGDCLVTRHDEKYKKLGQWVDTQRTQYRLLQDGKHSAMTGERVAKLEEIEFRWSVRDY